MASGFASNTVPGLVQTNAQQAAGNVATTSTVILDDATNGSVAMHLGGKGTGTIANGAGIGSGGTPAATLDANATDFCGQISIKGGTSAWATGAQGTVTFSTPYLTAPYVVITPANAATALVFATLLPYTTSTTTTWTLNYSVADSVAQHTYLYNFVVLGH